MTSNRKTWEEPSELFHARDDEESPRHDVGGAINELLTDRTAQDSPHELTVLDSADLDEGPDDSDATVAVEVGLDVVDSAGHKIGEVVDVRPDHLVVEKGFLVPEDVYVPKSAVAKASQHHLTLNVTREQSEHSGWEKDPDGIEDDDVIEDPEDRL